MKILKGFLIGILSLIGLASLILFIFFMVDNSRLSYLKTKNAETPLNKEYIIKNVNIIPMNKDTVLQNKMVQIKDGRIFEINEIIDLLNKNKTPLPGYPFIRASITRPCFPISLPPEDTITAPAMPDLPHASTILGTVCIGVAITAMSTSDPISSTFEKDAISMIRLYLGLTGKIVPLNPVIIRFFIIENPIEPFFSLAPITATDFGLKNLCKLIVLIVHPLSFFLKTDQHDIFMSIDSF